LELGAGLFQGEVGLGRDEVGDGLCLREIELAREEGSARELARVCKAGALSQKDPEAAGEVERAAMEVELDDVLARK
jgi:hypothetical protein